VLFSEIRWRLEEFEVFSVRTYELFKEASSTPRWSEMNSNPRATFVNGQQVIREDQEV
jgi:hypothetical protein